jgi:hypothetical protein
MVVLDGLYDPPRTHRTYGCVGQEVVRVEPVQRARKLDTE